MEQKFSGWIASISDGTQRFEQPPVQGERTSWQKLLTELDKKNLKMTGLMLQVGPLRITAMPHKECDGYYHAKEVHKLFWRGSGENPAKQRMLWGIGSVVGEKVHISWIDLDTLMVYQDCRDLASSKTHSTLKEADHVQRKGSK